MRASLPDTDPGAYRRRALLLRGAPAGGAVRAGALARGERPGGDPAGKTRRDPGQARTRCAQSQSALAETIAEQNAAIDTMIGEVSALRQKQAAVEAELAEKEARTGPRDGGAGKGTRTPGRSPRTAEPRPRGAARTAGLDLRGRLAGRPQRDPRIRRLVRDGGADRIPEPDPELRQLGRRAGSRRCATRSPSAVGRLTATQRQDRRRPQLDRRHRARSRRRQGSGRGALRRTAVGPGAAPRSDERAGKPANRR